MCLRGNPHLTYATAHKQTFTPITKAEESTAEEMTQKNSASDPRFSLAPDALMQSTRGERFEILIYKTESVVLQCMKCHINNEEILSEEEIIAKEKH